MGEGKVIDIFRITAIVRFELCKEAYTIHYTRRSMSAENSFSTSTVPKSFKYIVPGKMAQKILLVYWKELMSWSPKMLQIQRGWWGGISLYSAETEEG